MTLFIDACPREASRTRRLAERLVAKLGDRADCLRLDEADFPRVDEAFLRERDCRIAASELDHPMFAMARQFAGADQIVMAAPFWDLSFPAALKQYIEQINVVGIAFRYTPEGIPQGLCRAKRLFYVTTAGGPIFSDAFGFGYVRALAQDYWQIPDAICVKAEGLDIVGADVEGILRGAEDEIDSLFR